MTLAAMTRWGSARVAALVAASALLGDGAGAMAQQRAPSSLVGKRVRIDVEQTRLEGNVLARSDTSLTVFVRWGAESTVPFHAIRALWVQRSRAGRGAAIGGLGVAGAWALIVAGFAIAGERPEIETVAPIAAASAGGAALMGAGIGAGYRYWSRYPIGNLAPPPGSPPGGPLVRAALRLGWSITVP